MGVRGVSSLALNLTAETIQLLSTCTVLVTSAYFIGTSLRGEFINLMASRRFDLIPLDGWRCVGNEYLGSTVGV